MTEFEAKAIALLEAIEKNTRNNPSSKFQVMDKVVKAHKKKKEGD